MLAGRDYRRSVMRARLAPIRTRVRMVLAARFEHPGMRDGDGLAGTVLQSTCAFTTFGKLGS